MRRFDFERKEMFVLAAVVLQVCPDDSSGDDRTLEASAPVHSRRLYRLVGRADLVANEEDLVRR